MPVDRDLDAILNQALASYAAEEPDPALRARIVMAAEQAAPPARRIAWAATIALAAAALLIALLLHPATPLPKQPPAAPPIASASRPATAASPSPTLAARRHPKSTRHGDARVVHVIGHSNAFPTPAPLTAEEQLLLQFATEHPEQARQALAAPARGLVETAPLAIRPIRIAALSEPPGPQSLQ